MSELSHIRNVLEEIKTMEHVLGVSLISRGGLFILGDAPKGVHQETYAAMSAIMLGAAETTSTEMKESLKNLQIKLNERDLIILSAGSRYMLAITVDGNGENDNIAKHAAQVISRIEITI